jgi:antitoxin component of MazEF toxin-antitoxin module
MATIKLSDVGNSKGVILQKRLLKKYNISEHAEILELEEGILIKKAKNPRSGWKEAFQQALNEEDYDQLIPDFLDDDPLEEY